MILRITEGISRLCFKLKHWPSQTYMRDWKNLQLLITPGEYNECKCDKNKALSPWIFKGCWMGEYHNIDINQPVRQDFPAFCIPAFETDEDGRIVFILPERWKDMCFGRYTGTIRYQPSYARIPFNAVPGFDISYKEPPSAVPPEFTAPGCMDGRIPKPEPAKPMPPCCVLARFDLDFGPRCSEYITEQAAFEVALCREDELE